jgi:glycosyltransferase involved in cell wall biosynthesis
MRGHAVTAVDAASVAALRRAGHTSARLIPNGVDLHEFSSRPTHSGPFRFLFAGRHERQKGLDILLRATAEVRDRGAVGFVVDILGGGSQTERLQSLARGLGLDAFVRFLGVVPRPGLRDAFVMSDAFILPSRSEGMPIVILEAWAAHLAVIATRVGGVPDTCTEQNALLVPPEDPHALAQSMLALLRDPAWRGILAENGHRLVKERFAWGAIAKAYLEVYEKAR